MPLVYCGACSHAPGITARAERADTQTRQALVNIERILKEAGSGLDRVARCNLYLTDYNRLAEANEVYAEFFRTHKPAKTGVGVSQLWAGALIEIEVTAVRA